MNNSIIKDKNGQTSKQLLWGLILIVIGIVLFVVSITVSFSIGIFISIACAIIGLIIRIHFSRQEAEKERQRIQALTEETRARRRKEEQEREEEIWSFKDAHGECDRLIVHKDFRLELYNEAQKVIFNGALYSFSDILSCNIEKRGKIETASVIVGHRDEVTTTYTTKTSGKSIVGRAIAGGIVAGPVGAVIGGATAKRITTAENHVTTKPVIGTKQYKTTTYRLLIRTTKSKFAQIFVTDQKSEADEVKEVFDSIIQINTESN